VNHDVNATNATTSGKAQIVSVLENVAYDLPITDRWDFTSAPALVSAMVPLIFLLSRAAIWPPA